jgi:hypothetical protein
MGPGDRQQGYVPGSLYGLGYLPLMFGAVSGNPARDDLAALADEIAEGAGVLVIDGYLLIGAETAHLAALEWSLFPRTVASLGCSFFTHI